ncbi:protocadherin Fat 4-like isoform X2 [Branchiostoma floridae x Branchiostoma japonicum]
MDDRTGIAFCAQIFLVCLLIKSTDAITALSVTSQPFNVNEDATDGTQIIRPANIAPVNDVGTLTYSIQGYAAATHPFLMPDTSTGRINLDLAVLTLDFEQQSEYELILRADDPGDNTFASATVTVLIADVNEVPEFLSLPRTVRIEEDAAPGTVFNLLNAAFDQDVGQSLTYTINPASTVFSISGTNVETIAALDYETTTSYNLTIEVADDGTTPLTATSTLTVSIVDVNDQSPIYATTTCTGIGGSGSVNDDASVGSAISFPFTACTLTATDADSGDIITYSLSGTDSSYYAIDGSNPTSINVAQSLSGQGGSTHTITVTATDKAGNTGTLTVSVNVADTSDNAPICDPSIYFVSVSEDTATGTSVTTLTCTDADVGDTLTYTIISGVDGTTPEFEMSTGTIEMMETAVALDYDTLASVNYQYDVKVEVADGTNTVTATVIIQVTGINDNAPAISGLPIVDTVSEDASIGATVLAASAYTASDADDGADGDLTFSLSVDNDGGSKFDIVASTGDVILIDSLDTETFATYSLTITVTDGGTNPSALSASGSYNLIVTNVNDIAPSFGQTLYEDTILETATANTVVRTLAATEGGEGDTLTYSIVSGNTNNKFTIAGTNSDEIQLATVFDLTTDPMTYLLGVKVTDGGTPELTATTTVRVDVTLVNSDTPAFALAIIPSFVAENTAAGTVITTETATDNDYGSFGTIAYSYTVSPTSDLFVYDGTTGQLTLARPPDFESHDPQYEIIVTAEDGGGLTTTATLTVFITNTNDNTPYFDKGQYIAQIFESDTAGTEIVTMVTADADGDNTTTTIFTGNSLGKFQLKTGTDTTTSPVVELATTIDLSTDPSSYTLVLQVVDRDTSGLTGSTTINVIVTDTNTAPTIADATFTINEDAGIGDTVGTVQATDPDSGTDGELTYTTSVSPSAGDNLFVYDTSSGGIEVIGTLDFETLTQYIMTIIVQDGASASATASVTINIGDVNDVAPSFDQTLYQVSINEDEAAGTNVVTFVMTDSEGTGSITFDFVKGNEEGKFRLNSSAVEINSVINIDSPDLDDVHYTLVVKAMDGGTPELTSTATVEVEINPVNENPDFSALTTPFITQVQESDAIGTNIATLTAVDNDYGSQGELTYSLGYVTVPTTQVLTLDPDTAVLKVATALDYETQDKVYQVTVTATDGGGGSAVFIATVSIMDVNDNTPVFNPATYTTSIDEATAAVGNNVITVVSTDADDAAFGTVQYSISAGNADGVFTIDQNTGLITIQSTGLLDYETTTQYALTVLGKDGATGADQRTATVTVYVDVDPANEHDPVFTAPSSSPFAVTIAESAALGSTLYTVAATDQDSGSDGEIKFSITSGDLGKFNIDETSGVVYVADTLDRETLGTYTLAIRATDQGTTARTADVTLSVTVDDVNDNSPVCSPDVYTATLPEDTSQGTLVAWVLCSDADVDAANNALTYSITAGNAEGKFEIAVSSSGQVTVASGQSLDYETTTSYMLDVSVTDVSGVAVTAEVAVVVTGVNEFPPTFTATSYSADVNESLPIGTIVTFVAATDSDSGVDGTISYNITSGNDLNHFILDSSSGLISTAAVLDRETTASYSLVVTADDGGTTLDTATVVITVNDINDNAPVCPTFYSVLVSDATLTNSIIETVVCTDADISPNIAMSYSIVTGNTNNDFSIDSTGDVRVVNTLDDAVTEFYTLEVWVTDGTQYTTVTYVYVQVQDASTTGLTFIPSNTYSFSVAENSAVGTAVGTVYAGVAGGQIAFSASPVVSTGGPVTFAISTATEHNGAQANTLLQITNSSSGAITILIPPDRETDDAVQFVVIASSAGPPALSAEATIFVDITDVNDNAPVFVSSFYSGECGTTSDFGQAIVTISATDADEGTSGTVTYGESAEYPELFELDTTTGNIRLVIDQTLATQTAYLMTMSGTDGGSPALSSQTTVRVDAYDPYTTLVDIELAMTEDEFWTNKDTFLGEVTTILRTQYATARCGLAYITRKDVSVITTNRRRLLTTQGEVVARVYGVRNDNADTAAGINNNKEFFTDAEMLSTITGSGLTITDSITVQDYDDGTTTTTWIEYPASIALVVLSCIFFVLVVALIIALVLWCRRKRGKGKVSKKDSVKDKPEKQQRWSSPLITAVPANNATKPPPKRKADVVYIDRTEFDGEAVDEKTGREYYYNTKTGQRKWKDGLGNSTAVIVAAGRFKAPRNNPPKTTKTNRDSDVETIALDGTTFDGQARDPDTGRGYYFNSRTGDRKWKD